MSEQLIVSETDIREVLIETGRVPDGDPDDVAGTLGRLIRGETTMREVQGISEDEIEAAYAQGYGRFQAGNYAEAENIFAYICLIDQTVAKYWRALAATRFNQQKYEGAIAAYAMAVTADPEDPALQVGAAEALLRDGQQEAALQALTAALELSGDSVKHAKTRTRAEHLQAAIAEAQEG